MYAATFLCQRIVFTFAAICLWPTLLFAQASSKKEPPPAGNNAVPKPGNVADAADLEAFFDIVIADPDDIVFGLSPALKVLLAVPQVIAVFAALTVVGSAIAWKNRYWRVFGRVHYTLVALAGCASVALLYYWNFLTFGIPSSY